MVSTGLGSGDVFEIRVFGQPNLSGVHQVAHDGSIDFPLLGNLGVGGKAPPEVAALIQAELRARDILVSPSVSVLVKEARSRRVSVMGAVSDPDIYEIGAGLTVIEAVSLAGGFTALADREATVVTRRTGQRSEQFRVDVPAITRGKADNVVLRGGDIVFVPERLF